MTKLLQIKQQTITAEEIIPLLKKYQLLPQFLREVVIDRAIAEVRVSEKETELACEGFRRANQITSRAELDAWLQRQELTWEFLESLIIRKLKIEKFKQEQWQDRLKSYFLDRKLALEKVTFSLIRVKESGIATELYHRLQAGEQSFAELAREYSLGREAKKDGLVGATSLIDLDYRLAQMLHRSQPGQVLPPTPIGDLWVIVRLEQYHSVRLDEAIRYRLLNELFEQWLNRQLAEIKSN